MFPSDLRKNARGASGRVAGRVLQTLDSHHVTLADAFATLDITFVEATMVASGDWVVVEGRTRAGIMEGAKLVERHRPNDPGRALAADGETLQLQQRATFLKHRALILQGTRDFFVSRGFLEVETPTVVPSPGLDVHLAGFEVRPVSGGPRFLATSPEYQMKRLIAGGLPRAFQLTRSFRAGEAGGKHNPEFAMLEWYRAFSDLDALMTETEELVRALAKTVFRQEREGVPSSRVDWSKPFRRLSVRDAFKVFAQVSEAEMLRLAHDESDKFFRIMVEQIEPKIAQLQYGVLLHEYPTPFASLARRSVADPRYADRFELYLGGLELCNGFAELTDVDEQLERFRRDQEERRDADLPVYPIDSRFIDALREGLPPCAGNAMGLDRLVMVLTGAERIHDVMPFPDDRL